MYNAPKRAQLLGTPQYFDFFSVSFPHLRLLRLIFFSLQLNFLAAIYATASSRSCTTAAVGADGTLIKIDKTHDGTVIVGAYRLRM